MGSLSTSFHWFLTVYGQLKTPDPAGSRSLAGPPVHQDSLLPSLYGQIMSLIKPVWLWAPPSPAFPITCPRPCGFSSPGHVPVHSLSSAALLHVQHLCPGPVLRMLLPGEVCSIGAGRCRWVVGQESRTHREQSVAPRCLCPWGGWWHWGCASEESEMLKTEKNLKLSL